MRRLLNISDAGALALHAAVYLAGLAGEAATTREIAGRLGASEAHLSKVLQRLSRAGIVASTRGPGGGFRLAVPAGRVPLLDVYEAIEGRLVPSNCLFPERLCGGECIMGDLLTSIDREVRRYLTRTTLAKLARRSAGVTA